MGKPAGEEGGAGGGGAWLTHPSGNQTDRHKPLPNPPARAALLSREAPARPLRELSWSPRKFCSSEGPKPPRVFWKERGTEEEVAAARARGVHGARRLGRLSGGHRGGVGLSLAPSSLSVARNCPPDCRRVPAPPPAMSRLLPLLRSWTAGSLRQGPAAAAAAAAAPRPPSWCCCGRGLLVLAAPGGPRGLGTHPKKEPMEALNTAQGARDFIYSLHSTERSCLLKELHRFESIAIAQGKGVELGGPAPCPHACPPGAFPPLDLGPPPWAPRARRALAWDIGGWNFAPPERPLGR